MNSRSLSTLSLLLLLGACSAPIAPRSAAASTPPRANAAALTSVPTVRESAHALTSRAEGNLVITEGPVPGARRVRVQSGYSEVILARTNADGTVSTGCVDTPEGADAFLNDHTPSRQHPKAVQ